MARVAELARLLRAIWLDARVRRSYVRVRGQSVGAAALECYFLQMSVRLRAFFREVEYSVQRILAGLGGDRETHAISQSL